jgi:dsRNA-specific ribonuclease
LQQPSPAIVARAVQALFGAIWLDSDENMHEVRKVLRSVGLHPLPNGEQVRDSPVKGQSDQVRNNQSSGQSDQARDNQSNG